MLLKKSGKETPIRLLLVFGMLVIAFIIGTSANGAFAGVPAVSMSQPNAAPASLQSEGATAPSEPFDCSQISRLGIDKQMNLRADQIMAACNGQPNPGSDKSNAPVTSRGLADITKPFSPLNYGGTDINLKPNDAVIQSESMVWGNGSTIVATYNDLGSCTGGGSLSTNGGATFTPYNPNPFCTGHGTNFGDPTVVYNIRFSKWIALWLASGCGGQGMGVWTSTDGITWTAPSCAHNNTGGGDDRESMWVDNTPSSPNYGNTYASWNNFNIGGGALQVVRSTDGGTTWSTAVTVFATFRRNIQTTGGPDGTVFIGSMDEGGGGASNRTNYIHRSTDGGFTWTQFQQGPAFAPPGSAVCSGNTYFYTVVPQIRHMGWGQPAVGPGGVVHYVYAAHGAGGDNGNILYIRSTDNGATWSLPLQLNTDATTREQWMPSLSVTAQGAVMASWYDRRNTANNDYEYFGRASLDNGLTWQTDMAISDAVIPQPVVQTSNCYMGDYNNDNADGTNTYQVWTDSRGPGSAGSQDSFFDKVPLSVGTPTPTATPCSPPCTPTPTRTSTRTPTSTSTPCGNSANYSIAIGTATIVPGTTDTGNHTDDGVTTITLPFTYNLYGQPFTSVNASSNGNLQFSSAATDFTNVCLPSGTFNNAIFPHWDDLLTTSTGEGIFTSVSGSLPNRIFNIEWRAHYFSVTGTANFEVRLYEGQNKFDVVYGTLTSSGASATVGVQRDTGSLFTQFECNTGGLTNGLLLTFTQPPCNTPVPTNTPTATVTPCGYVTTSANGNTIIVGTSDIGNHCDDCTTSITLPFSATFYGTSYTNAFVSSNGNVQFTGNTAYLGRTCPLPDPNLGASIMLYQDDLRTDGAGDGIFTTVLGTAPNRTFVIEWRTTYFGRVGNSNEELLLFENSSNISMIYGSNADGGASEETGVQQSATGLATQFSCNTATITAGLRVNYTDQCTRSLVGHVSWQGRTAGTLAYQAPITLTLKSSGTEVNYAVQNTDASGFFTVPLTGLSNGNYQWRAKGPHGSTPSNVNDPPGFLAVTGTVTLNSAPTIQLEMGLMKAGDADNSNLINTSDFNILRGTFGRGVGQPGYDSRGDFDGNTTVNTSDFNLLRGNFGIPGGGPISPGVKPNE